MSATTAALTEALKSLTGPSPRPSQLDGSLDPPLTEQFVTTFERLSLKDAGSKLQTSTLLTSSL